MKDNQYSSLAGVYNALNYGCDYVGYADFLKEEICRWEKSPTGLLLDLACGTGVLTLLMRERGYDMTGVDISQDMLACARQECVDRGIGDVLYLCQDMRSFELFGTVDGCISCLDSINYLTKISDVRACFKTVYNYLVPNGVFIFDVNTPYRFKEVYGNNDYILENEGSLLAWQNEYNEKNGLCRFYLSVFVENDDGTYTRSDEVQKERCYTRRQIEGALKDTGFEVLAVYGGTDRHNPRDDDEKWYFVARCVKTEGDPNYKAD